jgi:hypothetical protein
VLELHAGSCQRGLFWVHIRCVGERNVDHLGDPVVWLSQTICDVRNALTVGQGIGPFV